MDRDKKYRSGFTAVLILLTSLGYSQELVYPDTAKPDQIRKLKVKANYYYCDSTLQIERHYDQKGRKTVQKCHSSRICGEDSIFYLSRKKKLTKHYDNHGKLAYYIRIFESGRLYKYEAYQPNKTDEAFVLNNSSEIRYRNGKEFFQKHTHRGKVVEIKKYKYRLGRFISLEQKYFSYRGDSLVKTTVLKQHRDSSNSSAVTFIFSHDTQVIIDTIQTDTTYYYSDYRESYIEVKEGNETISKLTFDEQGNLIESVNYVPLKPYLVKEILRKYRVEYGTYREAITYSQYNDKGLLEKSGNCYYIYDYY